MIYDNKYSEGMDMNLEDVVLVIDALQFYRLYVSAECPPSQQTHLNLYHHTANILSDTIKKHTPLFVSPDDTVRSVKALECMKNHFDLYVMVIKQQSDSNKDDILLVKKLLPKILKNMKKYSARCIASHTTPKMIHKQLQRECIMAQHGDVRYALDDMFKHFDIDYQHARMKPRDLISAFAIDGNTKFGLNDGKEFHILDSIITGTKHHIQHANLSNAEFSMYMDDLNNFLGAKKHGLKYIIIDADDNIHKVSTADFKKIAKNTWRACKKYAK